MLCIVSVLLCAGLFIRYIAYSDFSFTVLSMYHNIDILTNHKTTEIMAGESVTGTFKAAEDNLGIVAVRFNTFHRTNDDIITFRLKESKKSRWITEQSVRTSFEHNKLYNFGFTPIADSKAKIYTFEITSTRATEGDAIAVSTQEPVAATKYKFSKQTLIENKNLIPLFLWKKIINEFTYSHLLYFFIIFFTPTIWCLIRLLNIRHTMEALRIMILALIAMSIFLVEKLPSEVFIILGGTLCFAVEKRNRTTFLFHTSTAILIISAATYLLTLHDMAIRAAAWIYVLYTSIVASTLSDLKTGGPKK